MRSVVPSKLHLCQQHKGRLRIRLWCYDTKSGKLRWSGDQVDAAKLDSGWKRGGGRVVERNRYWLLQMC